jgi:hypothetical protein
MKQKFSFVWFLVEILFSSAAMAQAEIPARKTADNTAPIELGGKGLLYTLYYERMLTPQLSASIGFSSWHFSFLYETTLTFVPIYLTYYSSGNNSRAYVDGGIDIVTISDVRLFDLWTTASATGVVGIVGFGYCYRASDGGFFFKIGPMLILAKGVHPWGNLTLGVTF